MQLLRQRLNVGFLIVMSGNIIVDDIRRIGNSLGLYRILREEFPAKQTQIRYNQRHIPGLLAFFDLIHKEGQQLHRLLICAYLRGMALHHKRRMLHILAAGCVHMKCFFRNQQHIACLQSHRITVQK